MFLKPFLYLFVSIALISAGNIFAQDISVADSLDTVIRTDVIHAADPSVVDSSAIDTTKVVPSKPQKEPPFKSRIKYSANDSVQFQISSQKAFLYQESQVNYENKEVTAYEIEFDFITKIVYANEGTDSIGQAIGTPKFKEGNDTYDAQSFSYNFGNSKGAIHRIKTQQGEGYMHAERAKRYADGHIDMASGKYTTCDADHPHFYLALSKAKVMPGDQVVFGPAHLVLLDVPIPLYLPFGFFPYSNKTSVSGIIPPSIGVEAVRGLALTNGGYYFAFSDHFDATLMGDIYSSGTWKLDLTTRYVKRYKYSGNVGLHYGVAVSGEKGLDQSKTKDYSIRWTHTQDAKANPYRNFSASVNYSSTTYDKEFNYTTPSQLYSNTKNSSIAYQQSWPNSPFRLSINMNHSQNSNTEMVQINFPLMSFSMDRIYPFRKKESVGKSRWYEDITLQYDANLQNALNGKEGDLFSEKNLRDMKNGFQHKIPFSINFKVLKFFNITPSMNYNGVLYTSHLKKYYDKDSVSSSGQRGVVVTDTIRGLSYAHAISPTLSISATPQFYLTNVYGPNSKIEAIRTVISPSASINYTPDLSNVFNYYRTYQDSTGREYQYSMYEGYVYGTPSAPGQSGSISLGVNGTVEMKVRSDKDTTGVSKKIKIFDRLSATTSYNMFADSMNWSNIALSASTTIMGLNVTMNGTVDPYRLTQRGTRINQYGPRLTSITMSTSLSLPLQKKGKKDEKQKEAEKKEDYAYFDVPWNLSISYSFGYSKPLFDGTITQNMSFNGGLTLTPKWSLSFQSAYDFDAKQISYATATITRDLHCWEMSFNFSPFGTTKYFFFKINVKSGMLQDLKWEKRKSQYDYVQW